MLFRVSGKFADRHSFTINPVDGNDAKDALANVLALDEIKNYGQPVAFVTVKSLSGKSSRVKISDKPAAERKPRTASAPAPAAAATSTARRRR